MRVLRQSSAGRPAIAAVALLAAIAAGGCRQDMHDQPKYEALEASTILPKGTSALAPPENTVARGDLRADEVYYTGFTRDDRLVSTIPIEVDRRTLERGRETFDSFCAPCHDRVGTGRGMIVRRGFPQPPTYHQERLRTVPDGYIFDVITSGFGRMPSYASMIPVADRWATVAYVRALQLSQHVPLSELPPEARERAREEGYLPAELGEPGRGGPPTLPGPPGGSGSDAGPAAPGAPDDPTDGTH